MSLKCRGSVYIIPWPVTNLKKTKSAPGDHCILSLNFLHHTECSKSFCDSWLTSRVTFLGSILLWCSVSPLPFVTPPPSTSLTHMSASFLPWISRGMWASGLAFSVRDRMKQDVGEGYFDFFFLYALHYHILLSYFELVTRCGFDGSQMAHPTKPFMILELSLLYLIRRAREGKQAHSQGSETITDSSLARIHSHTLQNREADP